MQVEMLWPKERLSQPPSWKIPEGYTLRTYKQGDKNDCIALMKKVNILKYDFDEMLKITLPDGFFFIIHDATNSIVASSAAYHRSRPLHPFGGEQGWTAVDFKYKGKELGCIVTVAVVKRFIEAGYKRIYLKTGIERLPAIKTYLKVGYIPYLFQKDMLGIWRKICKRLKWSCNESDWIT